MHKLLLTITLLFVVHFLHAQTDTEDLIKYYQSKARNYLSKNEGVKNYYSINEKGISIFGSLADKQKNKAEFFIAWEDVEKMKSLYYKIPVREMERLYNHNKDTSIHEFISNFEKLAPLVQSPKAKLDKGSDKPLQNIKIAIDPGHISGDIEHARLEGKCLEIKATPENKLPKDICIMEGKLTFITANLLKQLLEEKGAQVLLTRTEHGKSSFGATFEEWLASDSSGYKNKKLSKLELKTVFLKKYNNIDLVNRAKIINDYRPDLTIVIHFNVDEKNTNWKTHTSKNYNMGFITGALWEDDMHSKKNRIQFLRMLISEDYENSCALGSSILEEYQKQLNVPLANREDADYLIEKSTASPVQGLYSRNLALTRIVYGPLFYGETLFQDNFKECQSLDESNFCNNKTPDRITQIAQAYYNGIIKYLEK